MSKDFLYDGHSAPELRVILGVPRLELLHTVGSTLDIAHQLAQDGAPGGTLVLADSQSRGRGRGGRTWKSEPGSGIWLTLLERSSKATADLLSIRVGLHVARVIDGFAGTTVLLKWPNDLYADGGKVAGILIESRWRGDHLDWSAIGLGINLCPPASIPEARGLRPGTARVDVLRVIVPALRTAAAASGPLCKEELRHIAVRDMARGRECSQPARGRVRGISADGSLVINSATGDIRARAGSLVLEEDA